ncbi:MAG: orotidine 5'-phosphate decarboxylase [Acidilobaceae archaeon]|nr:orotidine 5'-phosphate decarboxylase [Acidilobaceae archaeon]
MRTLERLRSCGAALQVALDFSDLKEALSVASLLPNDPRLFLEAGTPLIKAWGLVALSSLRALRPEAVIVADTKTVDAARVEAEIVRRGGADAFSVLSHSEEAIAEASEASRELGLTLYGDSIASEPRPAIERLSRHVDVLLLHVGIDVQRRLGITASALLDLVKEASETFRGPLAVAGGIRVQEVRKFLDAGARIVIIGSAITRAQSPREEALKALNALEEAGYRCR